MTVTSIADDHQKIVDLLTTWRHRYDIAAALPHLSYAQLGRDLRKLLDTGRIERRVSDVPGRTHSFPTHDYRSIPEAR